jgi:hypothetical protein
MKKILLLAFPVVFMNFCAVAQVPAYKFSAYDTGGPGASVVYTNNNPSSKSFRVQALYYPSDFPTMPSGAITSFYYRTGKTPGQLDTVAYKRFAIGINMIADSLLSLDTSGYGSFRKSGPDPFSNDLIEELTETGMSSTGQWKKISFGYPLTYHYDSRRNILLDIYCDSASTGFSWMTSKSLPGKMLVLQPGSAKGLIGTELLDIGFDIEVEPTGLAVLNNIKSFGLFPNPTRDGRLNVSISLAFPAKNVGIVVTDAVGRLIYNTGYSDVGINLFKEVDLNAESKGIYFLKVMVDGKSIMRQVMVE